MSRGTIEKAISPLRMLLDFCRVKPNPARDEAVRLPREERDEPEPPTAAHTKALVRACAPRYRLVLLILESTAMRVGELESLRWGDVDVTEGRWRVARRHEKGRRGRWVPVPAEIFDAVDALLPREDRDLEAPVFPWLRQGSLRTEMARACRAGGIPLYSPHDLRHRRISLWHLAGVSWAQIGAWTGQRSLAVTADTYTHVLIDGEIDHALLIPRGPAVVPNRGLSL